MREIFCIGMRRGKNGHTVLYGTVKPAAGLKKETERNVCDESVYG